MKSMFNIRNYADSSEVIGNVVFWTIFDHRVSCLEFKTYLEELGISDKYYREETVKANFIEAIRHTCKHFNADFKKLRDDAELMMFALYDIGSKDEDLLLNQHTKVTFYKVNSNIVTVGDDKFGEMITYLFNQHQDSISSALVRSFIISTIRDNDASLLRPTGGIYFIPGYNSEIVDKISDLMKKSGCGILYTMRVPNCDEEKAVTVSLAKDDLVGRLGEIINFVANSKKENTVENFLSEVNDVKELAKRYSELLNGEIQLKEVIEKCKSVETLISERMFELRKAKDERKAQKESNQEGNDSEGTQEEIFCSSGSNQERN